MKRSAIRTASMSRQYQKSTNANRAAPGYATAPGIRHNSTAPKRLVAPTLRNIR